MERVNHTSKRKRKNRPMSFLILVVGELDFAFQSWRTVVSGEPLVELVLLVVFLSEKKAKRILDCSSAN